MNELPTLALNAIFGYLNCKERIKCKSVCVRWRDEIKLIDKNRESLLLHIGDYPINIKWSNTNNRRLIRHENSFETKDLKFLEHPFTRSYFENVKKLVIYNSTFLDSKKFQQYINSFIKCEEIEIKGFESINKMLINLLKLRVGHSALHY